MIDEIELMRLRDIAFEYLPQIRDRSLTNAERLRPSKDNYWTSLFTEAYTGFSRSRPAIEYNARCLLIAVSSYATSSCSVFVLDQEDEPNHSEPIPTPQELQECLVECIANAAKRLSSDIGREIPFVYAPVSVVVKSGKQDQDSADWKITARQIGKTDIPHPTR